MAGTYNYTDKDRQQSRDREQKRRDRIRALPRDFKGDDKDQTMLMFDYQCAACGAHEEDKVLQYDHYIDLYQEDCPGTVMGNMIVLCSGCNRRKGDKGAEWFKEDKRNEIEETLSLLGAHWL